MLDQFYNTDREVFFKVAEEPVIGGMTETLAKGVQPLADKALCL